MWGTELQGVKEKDHPKCENGRIEEITNENNVQENRWCLMLHNIFENCCSQGSKELEGSSTGGKYEK